MLFRSSRAVDERDLQGIALGHHLFDEDRDGGQARLLRGAKTALAGDQLVLVAGARDDERLNNPMLPDAARQLVDRGLVEGLARLEGIRLDLRERNLGQPLRRVRLRGRLLALRDESAEKIGRASCRERV